MPPTILNSTAPGFQLVTASKPWRLASVTFNTYSSALAAMSAKADTLAMPTTDLTTGRIIFPISGGSLLQVMPIGAGNAAAATAASGCRVWVWNQAVKLSSDTGDGGGADGGGVGHWTPSPVCEFSYTLGTKTGVAGATAFNNSGGGAAVRYAKRISIDNDRWLTPYGVTVLQPTVADDAPVSFVFDPLGAPVIEIESTTNGSTGTFTSASFMFRYISGR